jgi:hypothetical protein
MHRARQLLRSTLLAALFLTLGAASLDVAAQTKTVQVSIWDETEENPLPRQAEVWIKGLGSWAFHPAAVQYGGDTKTIEVPADETHVVHVYPDGREDGVHVQVGVRVTPDMCDGCPRDAIDVAVTDDSVGVRGLPVEAQTGIYEVTRGR